jgi:hypothetical protein
MPSKEPEELGSVDSIEKKNQMIGLRLGALFSSPLIVFILLICLAVLVTEKGRAVWESGPQIHAGLMISLCGILIISLTGRWWGSHGLAIQNGMLFTAAIVQALILKGGIFCASAITIWIYTKVPPVIGGHGYISTLSGILFFFLLFLALGTTVKWRVRRAASLGAPPEHA